MRAWWQREDKESNLFLNFTAWESQPRLHEQWNKSVCDLQAAFGNISQDQSDEDSSEDSDSESETQSTQIAPAVTPSLMWSEDDCYEDYAELVESGDVYGQQQLLGMEAF